ncbi:GcrA family cell cycle regulator [Caulobacter sp. Root343]|uniref:GcrA family cell cycle regulator n=1 Tax=Caulobacter sp. Root343 TaxID=1736520 RepID=UPI0007010FED|nr:GcrA family cell cycle regulator [Caulobacter sp. Root343]KQV66616.1 hypothetical protein ASC70_12340 [Caulobacter sp. Root343]
MAGFPWTDENKLLAADWFVKDELSCSQIARKLSEKYKHSVTRNAVIGMLSRRGITTDSRAAKPEKPRTFSRSVPVAPRPPPAQASLGPKTYPGGPRAVLTPEAAAPDVVPIGKPPLPMPPPELVVVGQAVLLVDFVRGDDGVLVDRGLKASCCKYPVGPTPPIGEMHLQLFCAAGTGDPMRPYCDCHERVAWKPSNPASKAKVIKAAIGAAHRDMVARNRVRGPNSSRAVI